MSDDIKLSNNVETPITSQGLADHFKTATWDLHKEAETTGFINDILRGRASLTHYLIYLHNLRLVYDAMESSLLWVKNFPDLQTYFGPQIFRTACLCRDIVHIQKREGAEVKLITLPDTEDYVRHINDAANKFPDAMLAHIYVRYLGDLNGGQVMKRLLKKSLCLDDKALSFFEFNALVDIESYRDNFRSTLNKVDLCATQLNRATQAARQAFDYNIKLSKALRSIS